MKYLINQQYVNHYNVTFEMRNKDFESITIKAPQETPYKIGDYVKVQKVNGKLTIINKEEKPANFIDFYPKGNYTSFQLKHQLEYYLKQIDNEKFQIIIEELALSKEDYFLYPAGKSMHHAFIGGLAEHTLSILKLAETFVAQYNLDKSLLYTAIILHDYGKLRELQDYGITYSIEGNLLGHIVICAEEIAHVAMNMGWNKDEDIMLLKHMILAHHGRYDYGSPKEPMTVESYVLSMLDELDAKVNLLQNTLANTATGKNTPGINGFDRRKFYNPKGEKMIDETYNKWMNNKNIPADLYQELENMTTEQKKEAFYQDLEFGTAGMRGKLGAGTNRMNIYTIQKATLGLAKYLKANYPNQNLSVAIGYDSRHKSVEFFKEAARVLATYDINTYIFDEVKPTPLLSYLVRDKNCQAGIMITASHNPNEYNGYKVYNPNGAQLNLDEGSELVDYVNQCDDIFNESFITEYSDYITYITPEFDEKYIADLKTGLLFNNDLKKDIKIVFTPVHGTSQRIMPAVFKEFGYKNLICVKEQMQPDPNFTNIKSSNPEDIECYELALLYAKKHDADIIIANDPDADRLGIMCKDESGNYVAHSGNQTGTLLIDYIIANQKEITNQVIYKTIVTGEMGADIAKKNNVAVRELLTGFKFIGQAIKEIEDQNLDLNYIMGYEESYGYLIKTIARDKDAIQAALLVIEMTNYYLKQNKTLDMRLNELYEKHGFYDEKTYSISLSEIQGLEKIKNVMEYVSVNEITNFNGISVSKKVNYQTDDTGLPKANVIKFYLKDTGWLVFRPSGTEPKLKVYISVKAETLDVAKKTNAAIYDDVMSIVNNF